MDKVLENECPAMDLETTFFRMIRFTPERLTCDGATFIADAYRDLLGREPEFDPAERVEALPPGDVYESRATYFLHLIGSEEMQLRGYDAMVDAVATIVSGRHREIMADMVRARYPSTESLLEGLGTLMAYARNNSRRQDAIVAMGAA
jgi:hypothetical protein